MGHTITEKILAAHSEQSSVAPGDIVMANLDLVVDLDIVFGITGGHQTPTRVFDPDKIVVVADHGESINDHGEMLHGDAYFDGVIHVRSRAPKK